VVKPGSRQSSLGPLLLFIVGFSVLLADEIHMESHYFSTPQTAVETISLLMKKEDFQRLTSYYDLTNAEESRAAMIAGDFFIRREPPPTVDPMGFWRYKHPFPPGFQFWGCYSTKWEGVFIVEVGLEIDQGAGSPAQRTTTYFYLKQSESGWQILPETADPSTIAQPAERAPSPLAK